MDKSRYMLYRKLIVVALLLLSSSSIGYAQAGDSGFKKFTNKVKNYLHGDPWQYDSLLHTTHTKILLGIGQNRIADSYLSPTTHIGGDLRLKVLVDAPRREKRWYWSQDIEALFSTPKNPANGSVIYHFGGEYSIGQLFSLYDKHNLRVSAGPLLDLNAKGNLKLSNTNNVFNLKASVGIDGALRAVYRAHLGSYPLVLGYSTQLALFHLTFSPEYGQSYYDYISEQNRSSIKLTPTFANARFNFKQRMTVDCPIHNATITLGMEHLYHQSMIHNISYKESHVLFLIGYSFDFVKMSGGRSLRSKFVRNSYHP